MSALACHSCAIVEGRMGVAGEVLVDDPYWHASHMTEPAAFLPGMIILRARRHVVGIADMTDDELDAISRLQRRLCQAIQSVLSPERIYSVFFGEGEEHAHFVLVPRFADMPAGNPIQTLHDAIVERRYAISVEGADQIADRIAAAVAAA